MATYIALVGITVELDEEGELGEELAFNVIDETLQRAWDTDQGRKWITQGWHFEMTPGSVTAVPST